MHIETLADGQALAHRVADWMTTAALEAKGDFMKNPADTREESSGQVKPSHVLQAMVQRDRLDQEDYIARSMADRRCA